MFNLSGNIKEGPGIPESRNQDEAKVMDLCNQTLTNCASILTGISHEMRTQMNAVVAFSFMLKNKDYSEEEREDFSNQIYSSCEQIISLFDNFLDSAIIDTGNSKAEPGICDPDKLINNLISEFRATLKKDRYKDLILMTENQSLSPAECIIDTNRLTRVIRNLFENALSNTKAGYIKAGYYFRDDRLTFYILDSGQGYAKNKEFLQSRDIAIPLARFSDTYSAVNLALTRKLIQLLDGSVWIENNGSTGSGIYFSIPAPTAVSAENVLNKFSNTMSTI
ncbi:MAG: HAMP domain-containing sensor histidine kinase [Bacteroidota bacterium]|nr:HAMP domain-containing sensor histidine kinase [Bacteroidota bacterium]